MVLSIEKVLNGKYSPAARPYSQLELNDIRAKNLRRLTVGNKMACHDCGHIYFAKENGNKNLVKLTKEGKKLIDDFEKIILKQK